ncbi:MAG: type I methionyl aminopeptidase [Bacteroidales bacterium]|nr:type I methionyl aminopeptidase [Bacteroidales bacterium]MCM1415453.1 type I methionyl aminopeptidase [bacterium]MCM1423507.1 type I methionyl aminopeptidase [bacterium]
MRTVTIKTAEEIERMREAGKRLARVHEKLKESIRPGVSTKEIDRVCEDLIRSCGGTPNFLHYEGFPASVCVSVNDEVVHGIPREDRFLREGDIVSLDTGLSYRGYHADAARTYGVGRISAEAEKLIEVTRECFFRGIEYARSGKHLHDISNAVADHAIAHDYGIVYELVGHGIGRNLHEAPHIPNFPQRRRGIRLKAGMTLAIEPMINIGTGEVEWQDDGWTVVTADHQLSAHYENTVLVTDGEPEILTL